MRKCNDHVDGINGEQSLLILDINSSLPSMHSYKTGMPSTRIPFDAKCEEYACNFTASFEVMTIVEH
jgi:hypothetical protein